VSAPTVPSNSNTHDAALQVAQLAIHKLIQWADDELPNECSCSESQCVVRAKKILSWTDKAEIGPLRLIFDQVKLPKGREQSLQHYVPIEAIADDTPTIPYPLKANTSEPYELKQQTERLKEQIRNKVLPDLSKHWQNLSLLMVILEKFGSCLSFGEPGKSDVALVDLVKMTGAIAAALAKQPEVTELSLVAGDLSGIQSFIYTISSDGALKSLRARSFYLELVTEEVVQQLLSTLDLPRTSVIYAGGGNLYLLASSVEIDKKIPQIQDKFNVWLKNEFQGKIFLALDYENIPIKNVATLKFDKVIGKLSQQKTSKFRTQLDDLLKPRRSFDPCKVCHRDDTQDLRELNEAGSVLACPTCRKMFELGSVLFKVNSFVRSDQKNLSGSKYTIPLKFSDQSADTLYYHLFSDKKQIPENSKLIFLINNWALKDYRLFQEQVIPLLLGNYYQKNEKQENENGAMTASDFAEHAEGIDRVGYLRMDVDRLGQIFAKGLDNQRYLPKLVGLSRQMSYFFKVYLNSLAKERERNFLNRKDEFGFQILTKEKREKLMFIYAGGDDLFVSGSWNELIEFALDVYQAFRAYTGNHPDITLSGGMSIAAEKFPLYQAAEESGKAESAAKGNDRDSLGLFDSVLKWSEWLGTADQKIVEQRDEDYWQKIQLKPCKPELLGVLPFVSRIVEQKLQSNSSRNFVRNLLLTAQLQNQQIQEIEKERKSKQYETQIQDIRYYLHLPQIAYTLSRLPKEDFKEPDFRQSLKSPYNAPYFQAIATWIELLTR
jgi:CRISPR-associated protein Csm1